MALKEFYKNGTVYTFEMKYWYNPETEQWDINREKNLIDNGFIPVFDKRTLHYNNGKNGSVILENDIVVPQELLDFQKEFIGDGTKTTIHKQYTSLRPEHLKEIKQLITDRNVKNILIDSLFQDIEQFRYVIKHLFCWFTEINYFIQSPTIFDILKNEFENNMDKYDIRNSYYKHGANDKPYFNDLFFTVFKNNIYKIDGDILKRIKCNAGYEKCEVYFDGEYKIVNGNYKTDDSDITPQKTTSKWA